ncbi:hypothetical protein LTR37_018962 [Vermiconidia calcicola]|uniref:Uncharacterized protein n=1 Tax=Vermiconidia calcicola TaxID=1690605 RepID=A0ACC3MFF5_9PEZI|nr:hypothetical protein LTR37_018962 [Vermiconidia calcicola]
MQSVQRAAVRSARQLRPQTQRQYRRYASESSKDSHGAHHAQPANESLGAGFYVALAAIPASFAIFKLTQGDQAYFTRLIRNTYDSYSAKWAQRNDLHVQAMEQAAADRVLFLNESTKGAHRNVDIRFPEQFNVGAPWNVSAGQGSINIDKVIQKYEREAHEQQEKKLQQIRENNVPVEQPFESLTRRNAPIAPSPSTA